MILLKLRINTLTDKKITISLGFRFFSFENKNANGSYEVLALVEHVSIYV